MLSHLFEALDHCRAIDGIILATSDDATDDAVSAFAGERAIPLYRGSLADVYGRVLGAGRAAQANAVVRISGDSPLIDPAIVDTAVELFRNSSEPDLVSNVFPRSFPKGQSVEVIAMRTLVATQSLLSEERHREHVTPYFYENADRFRIIGFQAEPRRPDLQLSIDTPEDLARCEAILRQLGQPAWQAGWQACAAANDLIERGQRAS